jgi:hypothetical protein
MRLLSRFATPKNLVFFFSLWQLFACGRATLASPAALSRARAANFKNQI